MYSKDYKNGDHTKEPHGCNQSMQRETEAVCAKDKVSSWHISFAIDAIKQSCLQGVYTMQMLYLNVKIMEVIWHQNSHHGRIEL